MNLSPAISFRAISASVQLETTFDGVEQRMISLRLRLAPGEDVQTLEKRSLRMVEWLMFLSEGSKYNDYATKEEAIGVLAYFESETCHVNVAITPVAFTELWSLVVGGRLPNWLSITVKGMTYGNDPDGREKVWDVAKNRSIPITGVFCRFPVAFASIAAEKGAEVPTDIDGRFLEANLPLTSADFLTGITRLQSSVEAFQTRVVTFMRYVIAGLALFVLYILFK